VHRRQDAGRAETALKRMFSKGSLQRRKIVAGGETFDRRDIRAIGLRRKNKRQRSAAPSAITVQARHTPCSQ
jgi:hypothetical protein